MRLNLLNTAVQFSSVSKQWMIMSMAISEQPGNAIKPEPKINYMKRKILAAFLFLFIAWGFTSCEALNDCETCKLVTRNSSGDVTETGVEAEYCGATLVAFKAANPDITNPVTGAVTSLECN